MEQNNKDSKILKVNAVLRVIVMVLLVICSITCAILSYQIGMLASYFDMRGDMEDIDSIANVMKEIQAIYDNNYIGVERENAEDINISDAVLSAYAYALGDKYGYYLSPKLSEENSAQRQEKLVGIGIEVVYEEGKGYYVTKTYKDSPAAEAGIDTGDYIVTANGQNVNDVGADEFLEIIRGEIGTDISIGVIKASDVLNLGTNWTSDIMNTSVEIEDNTNSDEDNTDEKQVIDESIITDKNMTRNDVQMTSVIYKVLNSGEYNLVQDTGYIDISSFTEYTDEEFKEAIEYFNSQGIEKYIVDLRGNSGGTADSVIEILDYSLPEGLIAEFKAKDPAEDEEYYSDSSEVSGDFVVLVNESTASASELFSKAMQDYGKAEIIGTTTYGKGTVLSTYVLSNKGTITLSTAKYYTISGEEIEGVGVTPDYEVELSDTDKKLLYKLDFNDDEQFQKAVEVINNQ